MAIFSKSFGGFMSHIIRYNSGKRIRYFYEHFINKMFEYTFVSLLVERKTERQLEKFEMGH